MFRNLVYRILTRLHNSAVVQSSASNIHSTSSVKCKRKSKKMATLESLKFDNLTLRSLPIDSEKDNYVRQVSGACFSRVKPTPVENPTMVAYSTDAMRLLDLDTSQLEREETAEYFSGSRLLKGSETAAHCYCGHQFGHFSGQLGDGAAMYLGEVLNKSGERWEIQLKGAGPTPYSRTADGRKVLRSSIREFLCSEAMYYLGVGTTRAGTCVTSDSTVVRDILYNGNAINERCTLVLRIAPTFIRFGSFEIFKGMDEITGRRGPSHGKTEILTQLLDYTIKTFYPEIWQAHGSDKPKVYVEFFREVVLRTARLVSQWQCVGFCHGVLNTDNMSIVGITIDYGPYGFMDSFDPGYICNGSDDGGRYTYEKQPEICKWNCEKLAEAIQKAVPLSETTPVLDCFTEEFERHYLETMRKKFGLLQIEKDTDKELVKNFLDTMHKTGADFTNTFRCLSGLPLPDSSHWEEKQAEILDYILSQCSSVAELKAVVSKPKIDPRQLQMFLMILESNPDLLSQLGGAQTKIMAELERREKLKQLQDLTEEQHQKSNTEFWRTWLSEYTERLKEEAEGVSDLITSNSNRVVIMNKANPRLILRNYIAQTAIAAAEKGDYTEVRRVLKALETPYSEGQEIGQVDQQAETGKEAAASAAADDNKGGNSSSCMIEGLDSHGLDIKPPEWSRELRVT